VGPDIFLAAASGAGSAFGVATQLNNRYQDRLNKRFERIENSIEKLKDEIVRDYVLKEDFLREMQAVHSKLDRILDYLITASR
jgi:hypothetical protein